MKRQKGYSLLANDDDHYTMPMQKLAHRLETTIQAEVQDDDTLQALALRFRCSVAEIKRLNKIDKDNEIHARKIIKVPITPHSVLLETLPTIHKSGQNSPKRNEEEAIIGDTLRRFNEKLVFASSLSSEIAPNCMDFAHDINSINNIILNSKLAPNVYTDEHGLGDNHQIFDSLLSGEIDDSIPHPRPLRGPSRGTFECSGSDCDISWICLFICILALCFAIPLIYVLYIAEHKFKIDELLTHNHSTQIEYNVSLLTKVKS